MKSLKSVMAKFIRKEVSEISYDNLLILLPLHLQLFLTIGIHMASFYFISKNTKELLIANAISIYIGMILNMFNCYVKYSCIYI